MIENVREIKDHPTGYDTWLTEFQKEVSGKIEEWHSI